MRGSDPVRRPGRGTPDRRPAGQREDRAGAQVVPRGRRRRVRQLLRAEGNPGNRRRAAPGVAHGEPGDGGDRSMDKLTSYRTLIQRLLSDLAALVNRQPTPGVETLCVFDQERV